MRFGSIFLICFWFLIWSCKTDNSNKNQSHSSKNQSVLSPKSQVVLNGVQNAYNIKKFKTETQVKFNIDLKSNQSTYYNGSINVKTDASEIQLKSLKIDTSLYPNKLDSDFDKLLFLVAECYSIPFLINQSNFRKLTKNDSLVVSDYKSSLTSFEYKIFTHPITHIVQSIDYDTDIKIEPFGRGSIFFERYITVNRIPVAMKWRIEVDGEVKAEAIISRISYPKS